MNMFKKNGGFTLVELIVVIAILAILAGVAIPVYSGYITKANDAAAIVELDAVSTAAQAAFAKDGTLEKIEVSDEGVITCTPALSDEAADDFEMFYGDDAFQGDLSKTSYVNGATWYAADPDEDGALVQGWNKN